MCEFPGNMQIYDAQSLICILQCHQTDGSLVDVNRAPAPGTFDDDEIT